MCALEEIYMHICLCTPVSACMSARVCAGQITCSDLEADVPIRKTTPLRIYVSNIIKVITYQYIRIRCCFAIDLLSLRRRGRGRRGGGGGGFSLHLGLLCTRTIIVAHVRTYFYFKRYCRTANVKGRIIKKKGPLRISFAGLLPLGSIRTLQRYIYMYIEIICRYISQRNKMESGGQIQNSESSCLQNFL